MKNAKKILAALLALCMIFALAACGKTEQEDSTPTPPVSDNAEPAPAEESSIAGTYTFEYTDLYGDVSNITVTLEDGAGFTLKTEGAMGENTYTGKKWTDNGDGTFQTGITDIPLKTEWASAVGVVEWAIDGTTVSPVGYTVPTEFLSKDTPPTIGGEAVGIYTFAFVNNFGSVVPYVLWVNADNTYTIYCNNGFKGLLTYNGESWTIGEDGVISLGPLTVEGGGVPDGTWFANESEGHVSSWQLHGDGTCEPVGYESAEFDITTLPEEIYPANAQYVGIYTFAYVNSFGGTVPYIMWLNADGTGVIYCNNGFKGLATYTVESWTVNDDGTVSLGKTTSDSGVPDGDWFSKDDDHISSWVVNDDGTCVPVGFNGDPIPVVGSEQPAEIYPQYNTVA